MVLEIRGGKEKERSSLELLKRIELKRILSSFVFTHESSDPLLVVWGTTGLIHGVFLVYLKSLMLTIHNYVCPIMVLRCSFQT